MTRHEAAKVLGRMTAAWPTFPMNDLTAETWADRLASLEFDAAWHTADSLIGHNEWFPSIAAFLEGYRARVRVYPAPGRWALSDGEPDMAPEDRQRFLAMCQQALKKAPASLGGSDAEA